MCVGGGGEVSGILTIEPYASTSSYVSTGEFNMSVNVLDKRQNNLGESTHNIVKTRSMQTMTTSYYGANETT